MKCPECRSYTKKEFVGIIIYEREFVFRCNSSAHKKPILFTSNRLFTKMTTLIKCPVCSKTNRIRLNGNDGTSFLCRNRDLHPDDKNFSFTIKYKCIDINLKKYLIDYINKSFYESLYKIHIKAKKSKENIFSKETLQNCLTVGLNQAIIAQIFCVNQATISRYIKDYKLVKSSTSQLVKCKTIDEKVFYSIMSIDKRLEGFETD